MSEMIHLSAAVRQNLLSLQNTADLMSKTQNRLATGLKVNSALDNPGSFFTASSLNNRGSDLGALLDDMGQAVQTLKAADEGIQSITKLVEAAKGKANQALQSSSNDDRRKYATEYNELLSQIETLAKDAGYSGKNLLAGTGNDLSVVFNETGTSKLSVSAVDYTDTTGALGLADLTTGTSSTATVTEANLEAGDEAGDTLTLTLGATTHSIDYSAGTTTEEVVAAINAIADVSASTDGTTVTITSSAGEIGLNDNVNATTATDLATVSGTGFVASSFDADSGINTSLSSLTSALNTLRSQASTFGTNLTVVENRQSFTNKLINTLEEGAGKLTLADTNQEGANLLALQTRQQLSSTSLSFASQADQNVLRLF